MTRSLLSAVAFVATLIAPVANAEVSNTKLAPDAREQTAQIAKLIDEVFYDFSASDRLIIKRIADCESGGKKNGGPNGLITHLDENGNLITNRTTGAAGAMQILSRAHSRNFWARQTLDETQIRDNLHYARALIEDRVRRDQYKFADWYASKSCWQRNVHYAYNSS